jgi:hypothetical protein
MPLGVAGAVAVGALALEWFLRALLDYLKEHAGGVTFRLDG